MPSTTVPGAGASVFTSHRVSQCLSTRAPEVLSMSSGVSPIRRACAIAASMPVTPSASHGPDLLRMDTCHTPRGVSFVRVSILSQNCFRRVSMGTSIASSSSRMDLAFFISARASTKPLSPLEPAALVAAPGRVRVTGSGLGFSYFLNVHSRCGGHRSGERGTKDSGERGMKDNLPFDEVPVGAFVLDFGWALFARRIFFFNGDCGPW